MSEKFFLGTMTPHGFSTDIGRLIEDTGYFTYILKGGAGTGKSSLMKKTAEEFEKTEDVTRFYCSSDPDSLDAVVLSSTKAIVVDGTAPHVFDPSFPGACQKIVNLGEYWNEEKLRENKDSIFDVTLKNKSMLARAKRFGSALAEVCGDTVFCGESCLEREKLGGFIERFEKRILPKKGGEKGGKVIRQLSALTEYGYMTQTETLDGYDDIYAVEDEYYVCANIILLAVANEAVRKGFDVILCPSPAFGNEIYEHLLVPELKMAVVSVCPLYSYAPENVKSTINAGRFYNKEKLSAFKTRLKLNKLTAKNISEEIYCTVREAKKIHDEIERFYISSMDFAGINSTTAKIISELKSLRKN